MIIAAIIVALPITAYVVMSWLAHLQKQQHLFTQERKTFVAYKELTSTIERLNEEHETYKKKVDTLILKAGFKL